VLWFIGKSLPSNIYKVVKEVDLPDDIIHYPRFDSSTLQVQGSSAITNQQPRRETASSRAPTWNETLQTSRDSEQHRQPLRKRRMAVLLHLPVDNRMPLDPLHPPRPICVPSCRSIV